MFEQVGESRACGIFIARAYLVKDIYGGEFRGPVTVDHDGQSVREYFLLVGNHVCKGKLFSAANGVPH